MLQVRVVCLKRLHGSKHVDLKHRRAALNVNLSDWI